MHRPTNACTTSTLQLLCACSSAACGSVRGCVDRAARQGGGHRMGLVRLRVVVVLHRGPAWVFDGTVGQVEQRHLMCAQPRGDYTPAGLCSAARPGTGTSAAGMVDQGRDKIGLIDLRVGRQEVAAPELDDLCPVHAVQLRRDRGAQRGCRRKVQPCWDGGADKCECGWRAAGRRRRRIIYRPVKTLKGGMKAWACST